jgi:hypothetical protein
LQSNSSVGGSNFGESSDLLVGDSRSNILELRYGSPLVGDSRSNILELRYGSPLVGGSRSNILELRYGSPLVGGSRSNILEHTNGSPLVGGSRSNILELRYDIANSLITKYGCLIGQYAFQLYDINFGNANIKFRFDRPFEALVEMDIADIIKYLSNLTNLELKYKENTSKLPFDFRSKRYTIFTDDEDVVCHIYNEATYSVIKYIKVTHEDRIYNVANPATIMKYLFVNLWIDKFRFLINNKPVPVSTNQNKLILDMHKYYEMEFNTDIYYIGIYLNEQTAKKKYKMEQGPFYPVYLRPLVSK